MAQTLQPGTPLQDGKYVIQQVIGQGGFGNTYVATHTSFNETCAVKEFFMKGINERDEHSTMVRVSNSSNMSDYEKQREKFKKEAMRLYRLTNQHIVKVHDLFDENGTSYYVMDYIDGESLKERLKRTGQPMSEAQVLDILDQVLDALQTVHAKGLWHLDLKPANIMQDRGGTVRLIDFGASKQLDADKGGAMSTSAVTYTNGYAPREQIEMRYEILGPWTDFYALGATLFNLLTGVHPPIPGVIDDDTTPDKRVALPMPSSVSQRMRDLVLWLMKTHRKERPQSVQQIRDAIRRQAPSKDGDANAVDALNDETAMASSTADVRVSPLMDGDSQNGNETKTKSKRKLMISLAVIAGLLLVLGGYALMRNNEKKPAEELLITEQEVAPATVEKKHLTIPMGECDYTGQVNAGGIPHGHGTAVFANGDQVEADFTDGNVTDDDALYTFATGETFKGKIIDNQFIKGQYTLTDGSYFVGEFNGNKPGSGQWYDKKGNKISDPTKPISGKQTLKSTRSNAKKSSNTGSSSQSQSKTATSDALKKDKIKQSPQNGANGQINREASEAMKEDDRKDRD